MNDPNTLDAGPELTEGYRRLLALATALSASAAPPLAVAAFQEVLHHLLEMERLAFIARGDAGPAPPSRPQIVMPSRERGNTILPR